MGKAIKHIKIGNVEGTIWKNMKPDNVHFFFTISLKKNYKDSNGNWVTADLLLKKDLMDASLVLQQIYLYINEYKDDDNLLNKMED
jgi:hypothetical protein